MDFTDVPMLKIWPILADTDTDINIGASLKETFSNLKETFINEHCFIAPVSFS